MDQPRTDRQRATRAVGVGIAHVVPRRTWRLWWRGSARRAVALRAPGADVRQAIEDRLRRLATDELPERCLELARQSGVRVVDVSVRNQRSRWGACSSRHVITLNWRLVQMPESVADYVIFHELMHVRQPNHSRRFWREVDSVCTWWRDAERWLRKHGRELLPVIVLFIQQLSELT